MKAPDWSWTTPAGKVRRYRRANKIIRGAQIPVWGKVLEVGCGVGTFTEILESLDVYLMALDPDPNAVNILIKRNPVIDVYMCKLENFLKRNNHNAVVGSSTLHHLDIHRSLRKIFTLLKPGGRLCFAEPNLLNPQIWLERTFRRLFWYVDPSETAFTRWWIRDRLIEAGFVDVKVSPFDWLHPLTPRVLVPLVDRIGRLLEKIPVIREFAGSLYIRARKP